MTSSPSMVIVLAVSTCLLVAYGSIKREFLLAALIYSFVVNIELPYSILGVQANTQRVTSILVGLCYAASVLLRPHEKLKLSRAQMIIAFSYTGYILMDFFFALSSGNTNILRFVMNLLFFLLVALILNSLHAHQLYRLFVYLLPAGLLVISSYFIYTYLSGSSLVMLDNCFSHELRLRYSRERILVNSFAGTLALVLMVMAIPVVYQNKNKIGAANTFAGLGVTTLTLLLTYSRQALIALVFGMIVIWLLNLQGGSFSTGIWWSRFKKRFNRIIGPILYGSTISLIILAASIAKSGMFAMMVNIWKHRMMNLQHPSEGSLGDRLEIFRALWKFVMDAPVVGHGANASQIFGYNFESTYGLVLGAYGMFGIILLIIIILTAVRYSILGLRRGVGENHARVALGTIITYMLLMATDEILLFPPAMFVLAFVTAPIGKQLDYAFS